MTVHHSFCLQDINISFEYVDFYGKMSLILDTPVRNSKTQWTILFISHRFHNFFYNRHQITYFLSSKSVILLWCLRHLSGNEQFCFHQKSPEQSRKLLWIFKGNFEKTQYTRKLEILFGFYFIFIKKASTMHIFNVYTKKNNSFWPKLNLVRLQWIAPQKRF